MMRIAGAGLEAGAHSRLELRLSGIGYESGPAPEDIDEFILLRVRMPQRAAKGSG